MNYFAFLPACTILLVGFAIAVLWKYKYKTLFKILFWGAVAWTISILVKFTVAIALNGPMYTNVFTIENYGPILFYVYVGLLTGMFEIFIPLYIIKKKLKLFKSTNDQLGFGIGFGSFEAIALGIFSFIYISIIFSMPNIIPQESLQFYNQPTSVYLGGAFYGCIERIWAVIFHVLSALLIFIYIFRKKIVYLGSAIIYKTFIDATVAFYQLNPVYSLAQLEAFYGIVALFSLGLIWVLLKGRFVKGLKTAGKRKKK